MKSVPLYSSGRYIIVSWMLWWITWKYVSSFCWTVVSYISSMKTRKQIRLSKLSNADPDYLWRLAILLAWSFSRCIPSHRMIFYVFPRIFFYDESKHINGFYPRNAVRLMIKYDISIDWLLNASFDQLRNGHQLSIFATLHWGWDRKPVRLTVCSYSDVHALLSNSSSLLLFSWLCTKQLRIVRTLWKRARRRAYS